MFNSTLKKLKKMYFPDNLGIHKILLLQRNCWKSVLNMTFPSFIIDVILFLTVNLFVFDLPIC